jgi:hypothetical protein
MPPPARRRIVDDETLTLSMVDAATSALTTDVSVAGSVPRPRAAKRAVRVVCGALATSELALNSCVPTCRS